MTTITIKKPAASIDDDKAVVAQLPSEIVAALGDSEGSGFNLDSGKRDLFFAKGLVSYSFNQPEVEVTLD